MWPKMGDSYPLIKKKDVDGNDVVVMIDIDFLHAYILRINEPFLKKEALK